MTAKEKTATMGDVVVNVKADGNVVVNRRTLTGEELGSMLRNLVQLYPEQAVVIRGDETGAYKNVVGLAVGMAVGLGFGDNTTASVITRGLAETARLAMALGANPLTLMGLSFGGWLAAEIAVKAGRRIDKLILVDALGIKVSDRETPDILDVFNAHPQDVVAKSWHDPKAHAPRFDDMEDDELVTRARNWETLVIPKYFFVLT